MDKIERYGWNVDNKPGVLVWIDKHDIKVDHSYQRPLNENSVRRIVRYFDWALFEALVVVRRDGDYYVVLGQHRLAAAMRRTDVEKIPCRLFDYGGDVRREAQIFVDESRRKKSLESEDKFRAMCAYGDPVALEVKNMIDKAGYRVRVNRSGGREMVGCVMQLYSQMGEDENAAREAFDAAVQIMCGEYLEASLIRGLYHVNRAMRKDGDSVNKKKHIEKLRRYGWERIKQEIHAVCSIYREQPARGCAVAIGNLLNKGLRNKINLSLNWCKAPSIQPWMRNGATNAAN